MQPLIINFAPTGIIPTKKHTPYVPISAQEIIEEVHQAYEIGITIAHLHVRKEDGTPSSSKQDYALVVEGVRKHCPDLVVCLSLSGRNAPSFEQRSEALELYPDMASLTMSSLNFINQASINAPDMITQLAQKMLEYGVKPEIECFDSGMINYANYLIKKQILQPPFYFNILFGNIFNAQAEMSHMGLTLRDLPTDAYWAFGGLGDAQLQTNVMAMANGGGVRIGIEDNIWFDVGKTTLATNIQFLQRIHELANILERPLMSCKTFGNLGFYNKNR
jgi:uncharacterized protein (DUF849 family)